MRFRECRFEFPLRFTLKITFLLPEEFRILSAAFLGIVLGVILAIAALKQAS